MVEKIFPKLIRDEITKHLENVLFLCVLKEKEEGAKKQELYQRGFQKGKGWEKKNGVNFWGNKEELKTETEKFSTWYPKNNTNLTVQKSGSFSRKGRSK